MIPPWFQECTYWMKSVIWRYLLQPFIFSIIVLLFHGSTWSDPNANHTVSLSQHLLQPSILLQGVCGWFEKNWMMFIWGKPLWPRSFKDAYLFHITSCSNICLKSVLLNAWKNLHPPHSLLVNVLICNFTTVVAAIH